MDEDPRWSSPRMNMRIISKIEPKSRDDNGNVAMVSVTIDVNGTICFIEKSFDDLSLYICIEEQDEVN